MHSFNIVTRRSVFRSLRRTAAPDRGRVPPHVHSKRLEGRLPRLFSSSLALRASISDTTTQSQSRTKPSASPVVGGKRFADFDLAGKTFVVTGGARGLGLALAEGLVEASGKGTVAVADKDNDIRASADSDGIVYCLDREDSPDQGWLEAQTRVVPEWGGSLSYRQVDVRDTNNLNEVIGKIADENKGLHGVVAAAGIQQVTPALEYTAEDVDKMMAVNYTGVLMTATTAARMMLKYECHGSICMIASMSGSVANKGLLSPVYNSSKAALIQLARSLAMEWSRKGIRVNCLSPGHILTPMVKQNFEDEPELEEKWMRENMMGRLADTSEFKGAALFLLSNASSFMTGNNLVVDGGHTAW